MTAAFPLREIFNAAAEYHDAFPARMAGLVMAFEKKLVYVAPETTPLLSAFPEEFKEAVRKKHERLGDHAAASISAFDAGEQLLNIITLGEKKNFYSPYAHYSSEMDYFHSLDHEMGHLLVRGGRGIYIDFENDEYILEQISDSAHHNECVADAFAALRHIQRFGDETDMIPHMKWVHAGCVALENPPIHDTTAVIEKIARIVDEGEIEIASLSLQQTAELAARIAEDYALNEATVEKIGEIYGETKKLYQKKATPEEFAETLEAVARAMRAHKDNDDIYRAGRRLLDDADIQEKIAKIIADDPASTAFAQFNVLQKELAQHEKDSGFILDAFVAMDKKRTLKENPSPKPAASRGWKKIRALLFK